MIVNVLLFNDGSLPNNYNYILFDAKDIIMDKRDEGIVEIIKILIQWRAEGLVRFTILTPPFNKRSRVVGCRYLYYREKGYIFSVRG